MLSSNTFSTSQLLLSQSSEINTNSIAENDICFKNISLYCTERHFTQRDGSKLQPPESPSPLLEPSRMVAEDARAHRDCSQTWQARLHTFIQAILTSRKMLINHYFYKLKKKMLIPQGRMRVGLLKWTWRMEGTILECKTIENTTWEHRHHLSYLEGCHQSGKCRDWLEDRVGPVFWGGDWMAGRPRCCFTQKHCSSLSASEA